MGFPQRRRNTRGKRGSEAPQGGSSSCLKASIKSRVQPERFLRRILHDIYQDIGSMNTLAKAMKRNRCWPGMTLALLALSVLWTCAAPRQQDPLSATTLHAAQLPEPPEPG